MKKEKKSSYLAGISLAIMGAGFLLTIPFQDSIWGRLLQGGFEAGLVGGLADWFAVTALFRHPMGIAIPHTALLPKNRKKITRSVVKLLEEEWLTVASIMDKLKQIQLSQRIIEVVRKEIQAEHVKKLLHSFICETLIKLNSEKLTPFLEKEIKSYLSELDSSKLLKSVSNGVLARQYEEVAFDYILAETGKWASTPEAKQTMGVVGKQLIETTEADGLLKFAIQSFNQLVNEEKIGQMMQTFLLNRIRNVSQTDNRYRKLIIDWIREELVGIEKREQLMEEINEWKKELVEQMDVNRQINSILAETKKRIVSFVADEKFVDQYVNPVILRLIDRLEADEAKMTAIESWLHTQMAKLVERNHSKIGVLVKENLDKLDTDTLIDMMENHIGRDIQWIRVNGALCGFIIGLFLTVFKMLL